MKRIDKIIDAYQGGLEVGQLLVKSAVESTLELEGREVVLDEEMEARVMKLLCSAGYLYTLLPEQEYIHLLSIYFRGIGERVPDSLLEYDEIAYTWFAKFFAWGVSIYVMDSLDEWNEWLFDHDYIDEDEYDARVESEEDDEGDEDDDDTYCINCPFFQCGVILEEDEDDGEGDVE